MKQGLSLTALAQEIERQQASKQDIVASTAIMRVEPDERGLRLKVNGERDYGINGTCHKQIAAHTGIPMAYYDRMVTKAPDLLAENVNTWFTQDAKPRMLRTLDGNGRALLSDKFRPDLENYDLAEAILPPLLDLGVEVMSCQITERRLYIKVVDAKVRYDMPAGSRWGEGHKFFRTMSPGLTVSNSEIGEGALDIEASIYDKICTNLATLGSLIRKTHVGARHQITAGVDYDVLSEQTRRISSAALWAQVKDVVRASFDEARFVAKVKEKIEVMQEEKIEGDPVKVVEFSAKKFGLTDNERGSVLRHLIQGGDLTKFGLYNAITRTAEDVADYDRATDFEKLGGKIIELPRNEWQAIAEAA